MRELRSVRRTRAPIMRVMTAIGLSLIVVACTTLLIGAAAVLPSKNPAMFVHEVVPLSAAMLFVGVSAVIFGLIS